MTGHEHHIRDDRGRWHCFAHPFAPSPRRLFRYLACNNSDQHSDVQEEK